MKTLIIDTETTGLTDPVPVQVAYVEIDGNLREVDFRSDYFNPGKPIEYGAMATHHVLDEDVQGKPPFSSYRFPEGVGYIIGHNIDFDWMVLGSPDVKRICTLAISRALYPAQESHTLGAMLYLLSDDRKATRESLKRCAHSASGDCLLTRLLLRHLLDAVNFLYPLDFEELWAFSEKSRIPSVMSFGKHKGAKVGDVPADYRRWYAGQPDADPYLLKAWGMDR